MIWCELSVFKKVKLNILWCCITLVLYCQGAVEGLHKYVTESSEDSEMCGVVVVLARELPSCQAFSGNPQISKISKTSNSQKSQKRQN